MRQVVVAIRTTGQAPIHGARLDELAAVEVIDGQEGEVLHFHISAGESATPEGGRVPFSSAYAALVKLISTSPIVAHDIAVLNRFLRSECKRSGIKHSIKRKHPVVDTWLMAKRRFPRQRHDLEAVAKKLSVTGGKGTVGVVRDIQLLTSIGSKLEMKQEVTHPGAVLPTMDSLGAAGTEDPALPTLSWGERLALCWRLLVGQA